jgi:myo-inositol 2-dehydrogenase/D-chiro-inositol 1-dehydrogenase
VVDGYVGVGLIGAGRIGTSHAQVIAERVPGARLVTVADPRREAAELLASRLGARAASDSAELITDPEVDAVVIAASSTVHAELVTAAAAAGKPVFCEKPAAMSLAEADHSMAAVEAAGVPFQVGFNRRFAADFQAARAVIDRGGIGTPQLLRSLTRDPGLADPGAVPPWTIFTQTLIHDFDTLNWFNGGSEPVEVYASADALVAPEFKAAGLLDTAVVLITYDNGARGVAEASFSASYGYDIRGEVFGSAGMVTVGDGRRTALVLRDRHGLHQETARSDVELMLDAYTAEFVEFVAAVREKRRPSVTGRDARRALAVALAAIASFQQNAPVTIDNAAGSR